MIKKSVDTDVLLSEILHQLEEIKAKDVVLMDLRDIDSAVCSYSMYGYFLHPCFLDSGIRGKGSVAFAKGTPLACRRLRKRPVGAYGLF